jgi:hypothetical protein
MKKQLLLINLEDIIILLQLFARVLSPQMVHECSNLSTDRVRLFEPRTQYTCETRALAMALDHEAVLDQEYASFVSIPSFAIICDDFPCLARSRRDVSTAERTQIISALFIVVCQGET